MKLSRIYPSLHLSTWPIQTALSIWAFITSTFLMLNTGIASLSVISVIFIIFTVNCWFKDMITEASAGEYTLQTHDNLNYGFSLLILSEVILLFSLFWAFFHYSLSPSVLEGHTWPAFSIVPIKGGGLPLINTALLLSSGVTVTWGHHQLIGGNNTEAIMGFLLTIFLGTAFLINQGIEFNEASFAVSDGTFGSVFFTLTGFHGSHVLVGLILLVGSGNRLLQNHFTSISHTGIEASIWYWHFVDVVWLFVYSFIYWWGA